MFDIDENQLVAPLDHAKYIKYSSCLFFCPSFYAFQKNQTAMSVALFVAGTVSVNHWQNPTYSWRRIADHFTAKAAFVICFVNGFYLYPAFIILKLICASLFIYCFYMSDKYCNKNIHVNEMDPCWWKYHVLFHFFSVCSQMLIIYSM
jgi:hypothetical protein